MASAGTDPSPGVVESAPGGASGERLPAELTTGQAADLLGVSRATVLHLVERGDLAARGTGARRRLATADVVACRRRSRQRRSDSLAALVAASRDLGLYD
jgi:excisionase family DNA binding protein